MRELLILNLLWIPHNQQIIVVNFHQDLMASTHMDFFPEQTARGLLYWPKHSGETLISKLEERWLSMVFSMVFICHDVCACFIH